jgi:SagB-type dehydrogenase family enzyme
VAGIIKLPEPRTDLAYPLMQALQQRRSKRKWHDSELSMQNLADLLWAACGISAKKTGTGKARRTSPSACNAQEIRLYVAMKSGLFVYDENAHCLVSRLKDDIRDKIGTQKMMKSAPVGIIFVADHARMKLYTAKDDSRRQFISATDAGFISQNIYLYCAASGLNTTIIGLVNREELHKAMGLNGNDKILYTQAVGNAPV